MNTVTYLDILGNVAASGEAGIRYATLSRAAKRHVMSLVADGIVAAFLPSGENSRLDDPQAVVTVTAGAGEAYVALLQEGGLLAENIYEQKVERLPKANKKRRGKVAAAVRQQRAAAQPKADPWVGAREADEPDSPIIPSFSAADEAS